MEEVDCQSKWIHVLYFYLLDWPTYI